MHGVIVLKLGKLERTMLFCSWVLTYVPSVGNKYFVYIKKGYRIQNEDSFNSSAKLF